jgi:hypothetical protein
LSIVTPVAFDDFHVRVEDCPFSIAEGETLSETVGAAAGGAGGWGASAFLSGAGVGVATFFLQPVPETNNASKTIAAAVSVYHDLFILGISFRCFGFI